LEDPMCVMLKSRSRCQLFRFDSRQILVNLWQRQKESGEFAV